MHAHTLMGALTGILVGVMVFTTALTTMAAVFLLLDALVELVDRFRAAPPATAPV